MRRNREIELALLGMLLLAGAGSARAQDVVRPEVAFPYTIEANAGAIELRFAVLDGEFTFYIDGRVTAVTAGGSAFVPRGVPHCFKNCSTREARMLILFTPGQIEGFFDYGLPINGERPSEDRLIERIVEFAPRFGIEVLGPSPL